MAISISDFRMAIRIDNSEAKAKFNETKESIASVRAEMKQLEEDGKKNTSEYKDRKAQLDKLNTSLAEQRKEAGRTVLSYSELKKGSRSLKAQMDNAVPGTEKWKALRSDFMLTKQRMHELEVQARDTKFSLSKVADGFNKYAAVGASVVASLTGVVLTGRKCVDEFAEMQEAESQVRKYTNMTKEEVSGLNEEFKNMDTRTLRTKLNDLAGDAGKLGITAKKGVLDFVDAGNMINVALGEDLGADAVKNIGKLAQMFGEDKTMGLRGAMLATGSAINEVAQNSSAAEAYLVGFTARVAGTANQAKIAQGDIIGYASVLDQNMQQQEMAATAFQTLMLKMFQSPAKFAKMAGENVKDFTKLIKTDANEAILQFLETLNKKGGLDQLAPMFKEMGLDGVRASGVLSTMAGKIDDIRSAQKLANQAYRDGTSIVNEYNIQNNTVQAQLDKAKKHFADIRIELGEKLMPVMRYMITTGSLTVKGLSNLISIISEYKGAIVGATVSLTLWMAAQKGDIIITKLHELWVNKLNLSFKSLKNTLKSNIWGIVLVATGALIGKFIEAKNKSNDLKNTLSGMDKVNHEVAQGFSEQDAKIRTLTTVINDNGVALDNRRKALDELKKIVPDYNALLTDEGTLTNNNTDAIKAYLIQLEKQIKLKAAMGELEELYKKQRSLSGQENDQNEQYWNIKQQNTLQGYDRNSFTAKISRLFGTEKENSALNKLKDTRKELEGVNEQIDEINKEIETSSIAIDKAIKNGDNVNDDKKGGGGDDPDDKKPWEARLQTAENAYKQELLLLKQSSDKKGQTENEYQLDALQKETEYQVKRLAIIKRYQSSETDKKHLAELGKLESDARSSEYNAIKQSEDTRLSLAKEYRDRRLDTVNQGEKKTQLSLSRQYETGDIKERDYKNRLLAIEVAAAYSRLEIQKDYQKDVADLEFHNGEVKANAVKEAGDEVVNAEKQISERRAQIVSNSAIQIQKFNSIYQKADSSASMNQQLSALENFYKSQLDLAKKNGLDTTLLTSTYEEAKKQVVEQGAQDRADVLRKYDLMTAEDSRDIKLKALDEEHKKVLLSEEEYEKAKNQIANEYLQQKLQANEQYFNAVSSIAGTISSAIQGFQDAEVSKVTRKYDKQITAAKKAGKDTTKLEEEKEEAVNQVKKKYADKQFAAAVLQITASTAVAAMEAYKAMAGIPIVGPALGAAAAAAALVSGAAQIAVAKEQRDEAKGLKSGGYSDDYVEGYTKQGDPDNVAGVIPVHKNEFVTNHDGVANPHVKQFLDVFDVAQKKGTIRMINTTQILEQVRTRSGKYSGGYSESQVSTTSSGTSSNDQYASLPSDQRLQVVELLQENNKLLGQLVEKDWILDPRKVRDSIKRVEYLEQNVSR